MRNHPHEPGRAPPAWSIVLALALGCVTALGAAWLAGDLGPDGASARRPRPADRLQPALLRCQKLGDRALTDPDCRAAWAEHRRHFLGLERQVEPRP